MKSMKLSEYFQVVKPQYAYLKLTPDTSIRNYNSTNIAKTISNMYKGITKRIKKEEKGFAFETVLKCSYMIDIHKDNVNFYFIVPKQHISIIKEKIQETWKKVTVEEVEGIEDFTPQALKYQLKYKREDALSLNVNKANNEPLNSILNVIDIMQETDRIGVFYNFMPCTQFGWKKEYNETMKKVKSNLPVDREKLNLKYIAKLGYTYFMDVVDMALEVINDFTGGERKVNKNLTFLEIATEMINSTKGSSESTKKKKDLSVINMQMVVLSDSPDKSRKQNNVLAVCQSYKAIEEDNELLYKKMRNRTKSDYYASYNNKEIICNNVVTYKNTFYVHDFKVQDAEENKVSVEECQNFIQLPGRELLEQHKCIKKVDVLQSEVPKELQKGSMCVGESEYKGNKVKAYISTDKEFQNLTLALIGPTRAGKTTLISNLSRDGVKVGECTILFDFCGNCELSDDVAKVIDHALNINCSNFDTLQGLGYNEIQPQSDNIFEVYRCAKTKTSQLMTLINALSDDEELKARMERYLEAAAVLVFIQDGPIRDVFGVLQDHVLRGKYIDNYPLEQRENLEDYISALQELNDWSRATKDNPAEIIGTKLSYIQGILNRVSKLKQNTYMELMLKKDCTNNINLVDEMQKAQLICIRMPEVMFSTQQEKDIYCTYWLTKIWGALQVRKWNIKKRTKVNIIFDELYQVPSCQDFLKSKLSQIAKFNAKSIISCHYLGQIQNIRNELKAANTSYMLISGCDKDNFKELKEELSPYELEDLLNLKRYHSLNLIKYEGGWAKFITKLPPPIK